MALIIKNDKTNNRMELRLMIPDNLEQLQHNAAVPLRFTIANKVRNIKLFQTQKLIPLFEVISNSLNAISKAKKSHLLKTNGSIHIKIIRNGDEELLKVLSDIDKYPINSFEIEDDGIGLNDDNFKSFKEPHTGDKIKIGDKGVGRFVCLKAFCYLLVDSCCSVKGQNVIRSFNFYATDDSIRNYTEIQASESRNIGTTITLSNFRDDFRELTHFPISEIAKAVLLHFYSYFLQDNGPEIVIENQNNEHINLKELFLKDYKQFVQTKDFQVSGFPFKVFLVKTFNGSSHKIHYCAQDRNVIKEGLYGRIASLDKYSIADKNGNFYYHAFIFGDILNDNVDWEKGSFNFPDGTDDEEGAKPITLSKIRKESVNAIEELLNN
jgi:hypothetical protein